MPDFNPTSLFLVITALLPSCQSAPLPQKPLNEHMVDFFWVADYQKAKALAKTDKTKSCEIFLKLANDETVSIKDVAFSKALSTCSETALKDQQRDLPEWLKRFQHLAYSQNLSPILQADYREKHQKYFTDAERIRSLRKVVDKKLARGKRRWKYTSALYKLVPRLNPKPKRSEYIKYARSLFTVRDYKKARKYLKKVMNSKKSSVLEKFKAHKSYFYSYKVQRNKHRKQFLAAAKSWGQFYSHSAKKNPKYLEKHFAAQINWARTIWTYVGTEEALKILEKMPKYFRGKHSLSMTYWVQARIYEEKKNFKKALAFFDKALKEPTSLWSNKEKILWSYAWLSYKQGLYAQATSQLNTLINHRLTTPFAKFKYLYWLGRAQAEDKQVELAQSTWQKLIKEDSFGYYGLLAHHHTGQELARIDQQLEAEEDLSLLSDANKDLFLGLIETEEQKLAARFLRFQFDKKTMAKVMPVRDVGKLFSLYNRTGLHNKVFYLFGQLDYAKQSATYRLSPGLLFPRPFLMAVNDTSNTTKLQSEIIYSIIRQESAFNPTARSHMDAFGLMQVLPSLARKTARKYKIPYKNYHNLLKPKTNILIGSYAIKGQMKKYKDKFILFVASYNASDSAVKQWYDRSKDSGETNIDPITFIENIPYEETKTYVKLVLRNYIHYKKLSEGDDFKSFPIDLLKI